MPWPCGLVVKKGVNSCSRTCGRDPRTRVLDLQAQVPVRPPQPDGHGAAGCPTPGLGSALRRARGRSLRSRSSRCSGAPAPSAPDPAPRRRDPLRSPSATRCRAPRDRRARAPRCGAAPPPVRPPDAPARGRRTTSAKLRMNTFSCPMRSIAICSARSKSARSAPRQLRAVTERRLQQRAGRAHRVVDLVRHHADQLLVGRLLRLPQFLGQLLEQEEAAREAAIEERAALHARTRRPPCAAGDAALSGRQ